MRTLADSEHIRLFMRAVGGKADAETRVYFTGGATAVLLGWRPTTIDIDIKIVPERDRLLRAIPQIKEDLRVNVELAWPLDFIPVPARVEVGPGEPQHVGNDEEEGLLLGRRLNHADGRVRPQVV